MIPHDHDFTTHAANRFLDTIHHANGDTNGHDIANELRLENNKLRTILRLKRKQRRLLNALARL